MLYFLKSVYKHISFHVYKSRLYALLILSYNLNETHILKSGNVAKILYFLFIVYTSFQFIR